MPKTTQTAVALAAALATTICLAPASAQAQAAAPFEAGQPVGLQDLPPGRLRSKIDSLPGPAQARALDWLSRFSFTEQDLPYLQVDKEGAIYFEDTFRPEDPDAADSSALEAPATAAALTAAETFSLHSNPGAPNVVFVDVDGHSISGTAWNSGGNTLEALPYDTDGNLSSFSATELANIHEIWHRIAEDLAPFDIDVTTEEPSVFGPNTGRILITRDSDANGANMPAPGAGGVAYVNVWGRSDYHTTYSPALVYYDNLGSGFPPYIAEASSHELGHNLGLSHDGTNSLDYYEGHGSGFVSWAPIMGVGYSMNVTQWSRGEYSGANQSQDDLAIIDGKLSTRFDDHGDSLIAATALAVEPSGAVLVSNPESDPANLFADNKGVIEVGNDADVFWFDSAGGPLDFTVTPAWDAFPRSSRRGANLDIHAALYDAGGSLVAESDPLDDTHATLAASVAAGRYYLAVSGVGNALSPYSDYGSLGQYFISGSVTAAPADTTAPTPNPMAWLTAPAAVDKGSIAMTAQTASDDSGVVEYSFACTSGGQGCVTSAWQTGTSYVATGLAAGTSYSFQVKARDGSGNETGWSPVRSATTGANAGPIAVNDTAIVDEDSSVSITVLANDNDPEGDVLSITNLTSAGMGNVAIDGSTVIYTPDPNVNGDDSFTYTASDGFGGSATALVQVSITPVNDAPTALDDSATVATRGSVTVKVLENDVDIEGQAIFITGVTNGNKGSVTATNATVTYTAGRKGGSDSFTYTVSDGQSSSTGTVSIAITKNGGSGGSGKCHPKRGCASVAAK